MSKPIPHYSHFVRNLLTDPKLRMQGITSIAMERALHRPHGYFFGIVSGAVTPTPIEFHKEMRALVKTMPSLASHADALDRQTAGILDYIQAQEWTMPQYQAALRQQGVKADRDPIQTYPASLVQSALKHMMKADPTPVHVATQKPLTFAAIKETMSPGKRIQRSNLQKLANGDQTTVQRETLEIIAKSYAMLAAPYDLPTEPLRAMQDALHPQPAAEKSTITR